MMEEAVFSLGVEEVALAMSVVDRPEVAHNLILAQLGEMDRQEVRARLLTAGHSLMARGWLSMGAEGTMHLSDPLARIAHVLTDATFSVRYSRSYESADYSLTFHFGENGIFSHSVEQGVVHSIAEVEGAGAVIEGGLSFFEVSESSPFACEPVEVPSDLLDKVKGKKDLSSILLQLEEAGVVEETRALLAEHVQGTRYRGGIMRVEYDEESAPYSNNGLLVLRGPERLWLLRLNIKDGEDSVTLLPGTEEVFREEVAALLQ